MPPGLLTPSLRRPCVRASRPSWRGPEACRGAPAGGGSSSYAPESARVVGARGHQGAALASPAQAVSATGLKPRWSWGGTQRSAAGAEPGRMACNPRASRVQPRHLPPLCQPLAHCVERRLPVPGWRAPRLRRPAHTRARARGGTGGDGRSRWHPPGAGGRQESRAEVPRDASAVRPWPGGTSCRSLCP